MFCDVDFSTVMDIEIGCKKFHLSFRVISCVIVQLQKKIILILPIIFHSKFLTNLSTWDVCD